ncbi:hypothetical protein ABVC96_20845 [Xanthomonas euvesicatoria]|nr:hypothetical protein [Xanthomonas phage MYK3]
MKQFQYVNASTQTIAGPYDENIVRTFRREIQAGLAGMEVGSIWRDPEGDVWTRLPDRLSDDVPMTETDVADCRASASRVRQSLRLERIATAAMAAIIGKNPAVTADTDRHGTTAAAHARGAIIYAKALIAELDKQA